MKRTFNDDIYAVKIAEWEKDLVPKVLLYGRLDWGVPIIVTGLLLLTMGDRKLSDYSLGQWGAYVMLAYLCLSLFTFLHEINENLRFVRHKLQVQREAVGRAADQFRGYKKPEAVTVFDALDTVEREWSE